MIYEDELVKLHCGDCVEVMQGFEENSIDAIITDPPYGLEFMGKDWDKLNFHNSPDAKGNYPKSRNVRGVKIGSDLGKLTRNLMNPTSESDIERKEKYGKSYAGRRSNLPDYGGSASQEMQLWHYQWAMEALRVVKPGGYLLAFGGTRTFHRLACAIEDAGFEFRDTVMWVYGCLSEDTEILTINGWEHYHKNIINNSVLCYNIEENSFEFHKPIRDYFYENKHTAYRIKSDKTDQIVSRNHRVLIEQEGKLLFKNAEKVAQEQEASIPFLESLRDLPETIYDFQSYTSIKKQDLLKKLCDTSNEKTKNTETYRATEKNTYKMCSLQKGSSEAERLVEENKDTNLFLQMQREVERTRVEETRTQRQSKLEAGIGTSIKGTNDWRKKSSLERWSNLFQKARELLTDKICQMSKRIHSYGSQGRLCYGTSFDNGSIVMQVFRTDRSSTSYQSQPYGQSNRELNAIQNQSGTQTSRRTKATITPLEYNGNVWCIEVPTGAFVARRNGMIFITGNSGFPKSLDVSKAIDKMKGVERTEVTGTRHRNVKPFDDEAGWNQNNTTGDFAYTAPASPEAKEWEGWGTALKPAWEPILIFRKPVEGTVAENVLKYGTGAMNIDESRVPVDSRVDDMRRETDRYGRSEGSVFKTSGFKNENNPFTGVLEKGRFPANLMHDGSEEVEELFPEQTSGAMTKPYEYTNTGFALGKPTGETKAIHDASSVKASRFFYCAKADKGERDLGLEFDDGEFMDEGREEGSPGGTNPRNRGAENKRANFHPTVKPVELMKWLINLVTRENSLILDPFAGSGSTLVACKKLGRRVVGIEKDESYCRIIEKRLKAPLQKTFF